MRNFEPHAAARHNTIQYQCLVNAVVARPVKPFGMELTGSVSFIVSGVVLLTGERLLPPH